MRLLQLHRKREAFTLVEILLVIAIFGILAALLFPIAARMREKGRQTTCQQNLRQIHAAMLMYVQDHDSHFSRFDWDVALAPYVKSPAIFLCPTQIHPHGPELRQIKGDPRKDYISNLQLIDISYVEGHFTTKDAKFVGSHEARFEQTSKFILFFESWHDGMDEKVFYPAACGNLTMANGRPDKYDYFSTVHSGGGNIVFLDGHAKWFNPQGEAEAFCDSLNNGPVSPLFRKPK